MEYDREFLTGTVGLLILTPGAVHVACARFGGTGGIGDWGRRVYRRDSMLFYNVKVGACIAAATMAASLMEAIAGLRLASDADGWRLSPDFAHAARFGVV